MQHPVCETLAESPTVADELSFDESLRGSHAHSGNGAVFQYTPLKLSQGKKPRRLILHGTSERDGLAERRTRPGLEQAPGLGAGWPLRRTLGFWGDLCTHGGRAFWRPRSGVEWGVLARWRPPRTPARRTRRATAHGRGRTMGRAAALRRAGAWLTDAPVTRLWSSSCAQLAGGEVLRAGGGGGECRGKAIFRGTEDAGLPSV